MYTSEAHKEGKWWIVQNDQVPGAISQVTRLDQAAEVQREAIAFVAGVAAESVDVVVRVRVNEQIDREVAEVAALRAEAQEKEARAAALRLRLAHLLESEGYTMRDIGVVLNISYQRVHQLTRGPRTAAHDAGGSDNLAS